MALTLSEDAKMNYSMKSDKIIFLRFGLLLLCAPLRFFIMPSIQSKKSTMDQYLCLYWFNRYTFEHCYLIFFECDRTNRSVFHSTKRYRTIIHHKKSFKYIVSFQLQGELVRMNLSLTAIGINIKTKSKTYKHWSKQ